MFYSISNCQILICELTFACFLVEVVNFSICDTVVSKVAARMDGPCRACKFVSCFRAVALLVSPGFSRMFRLHRRSRFEEEFSLCVILFVAL